MSVRLNLLPDLRQQRLKDAHRRQSATLIAIIVSAVAGGVTLLLALYNGTQNYNIKQTSNKITTDSSELSAIPGLTDALTAQQHLAALPDLDSQRVYFSKFFDAYNTLAPGDVALTSIKVDESNVLTANGTSTTYYSVTKLAAALAAEHVTIGAGANASNTPYFTDIEVSQVSRQVGATLAQFTLTATIGGEAVSGK